MAQENRFFRLLVRRWWVALLVMGLSFVMFGLASVNLLAMLQANLRFLTMNGLDAIRDGGLVQLAEIVTSGYLAAGFYVVFKACEKALVWRLTHYDEDAT